ncbi:MAG: hypothetical protein KAG94_03245 [Clostridiales bacterium]|nr:hypothetical protein [Clostridiales bacterium]
MKNKTTQIVIMIILLLAVIVQAIIILDYYLDTYSLGIFDKENNIESYYHSFEEEIYTSYLQPYRMIVKSGVNDSWIIKREDSTLYEPMWAAYQEVLRNILQTNASYKTESNSDWDNIYKSEGVTLDFMQPNPVEFVALMVQAKTYQPIDAEIEKIHIKPENDNLTTIYIKTTDYVLIYSNVEAFEYFTRENYSKLYNLLENTERYDSSRYFYYSRIISNSKIADLKNNLDIPVKIDNEYARTYQYVTVNPFVLIKGYNETSNIKEKNQMVENIKRLLLGVTHDQHKTTINADNDIFFSNEYNLFSIEDNSRFTYKFIATSAETTGDVKSAFYNAIELLTDFFYINGSGQPKLIVRNVTKEEDGYLFEFSYIYHDLIILFEDENNMIKVKANKTRVLEASGKLLTISPLLLSNTTTIVEEDYYANFIKVIEQYQINLLQLSAKNIYVGYVIGEEDEAFLIPKMIVEEYSGDKQVYDIEQAEE